MCVCAQKESFLVFLTLPRFISLYSLTPMKSCVYFPKTPWIIAFFLPILTYAYGSFCNFPIFFFLSTVLILVSSTFLFLPLAKLKVQVLKKEQSQQQDGHDLICSDRKISTQAQDEVKIGFSDKGLPESFSENDIIGRFSSTSEEDSDFDCGQFPSESPDCSDEESLIEIELPAGNYVGLKGGGEDDDEEELCFEQLSPESIYRWSEMNEEENLIEIDISMGSIK
ncbi:hypothetical protein Lser_V15G24900 [Lactuca serriola]